MTADHSWGRLRELFERAIDEEPADLAAWLDREGVRDPGLREEVASLLAHHAQAGSFLDSPAADRLSDLMADDSPAAPGQVIGPYTIVRELGRGGMGHVYLATDARLGRRVALKALRPALTADPAHRDRLRREARAAGSLTHPGICTVYALEEFDGQLYIAAEFVEGETLRDAMRTGTDPPVAEVMRTVRDLADALASAHTRGITHRDLKPENVMRTRDGRLKILDFGLASLDPTADAGPSPLGSGDGDGSPRLTQPGTLLGTPAYMAPEQLNGQTVDARADVFALGVLTYEYACRSHPFSAATPLAVVARILESEAVSLDRWRPDLPPDLVVIVGRCLRKRPADRFASAAELARALTEADTSPTGSRLAAWWRTHQLAAIGLYLAACGLAWQIKEWQPGLATAAFVATCIAATVGGILRGHLLFTERVTAAGLATQRERASPVTLMSDLLIGVLLATSGILLTATRPVIGALTIALGVGIALARVVVEPATTDATFRR